MSKAHNVLGTELQPCGLDPLTGFYRNGCCDNRPGDEGLHIICCQMTEEFLEFSKSRGNDLSTPNPMFDFGGLNPGDRWCLCALRWKEAYAADMAPRVFLEATHISMLEFVDLDVMREHAAEEAT